MSPEKKRASSEKGQDDAAEGKIPRVAAAGKASQHRAPGAQGQPVKLHSPLFPLLWLLFPFLAMLTYGLFTRH
jgi:hypothetical protein